jgi:hypothetical protein
MPVNPASILDSTKQLLGVGPDDDSFDVDIITHINTTFKILDQLGTGPEGGMVVTDSTQLWTEFDPEIIQPVKSYVYMTTRLLFDPPVTSFALDAAFKVRDELGWRINIAAEEINPPPDPLDPLEPPFGGSLTTAFAPKVVNMPYASVVTPDATQGNVFYLTLEGPCTINAPSGGLNGQHITMELTSNGFPVIWGSGWNFGGTGIPVLRPDKTDIISAVFHELFAEWHAGYTLGF